MGIDLVDQGDDNHELFTKFGVWEYAWEWIRRSGIIEDQPRLERMSYNGATKVTADEARRLADYFETWVVPTIPESWPRVRAWAPRFVEFCRNCEGFTVY